MMSEARYHQPVMLSECISALNIDPEGIYVDVTFGGGGHSLKILENIKGGRLIAFDQDEDAKREADKINHRSFTFCQANFMYMKRYLKLNQITKVNGVLADLGISSHQIDAPDRGFSTRFDGPLDMRMDVKSSINAAKLLNEYPEEQLHKIFGMYGEVKNARTAVRAIIQERANKKFERNFDLLKVLKPIAPRGKDFKYYAQIFQALRIEVNKEMEALETFLMQCSEIMDTGGRLVVMSYHSLEDRMVKNYINTGKIHGDLEKDFYGNPIRPFAAITRKPVTPGEEELEQNNRARSAKLRIAERL